MSILIKIDTLGDSSNFDIKIDESCPCECMKTLHTLAMLQTKLLEFVMKNEYDINPPTYTGSDIQNDNNR